VGIAGCGGLGSNAAVALARAGIGKLVLVDGDRVEASNLNRQHFFANDIGRLKVDALAAHLRAIHGKIGLVTHAMSLTPEDLPVVFREADLLIEAFDRAEDKQWLIESWCRVFPERPIVVASGLGGYGRTAALQVRSTGRLHVCGDCESDMSLGLCSARVAIVAAMQANVAIELLMADGS
jgi:sulfur carrier protein ThiS adenylyltransferase